MLKKKTFIKIKSRKKKQKINKQDDSNSRILLHKQPYVGGLIMECLNPIQKVDKINKKKKTKQNKTK